MVHPSQAFRLILPAFVIISLFGVTCWGADAPGKEEKELKQGITALQSKDTDARFKGFNTIKQLGYAATPAIPALVAILKEKVSSKMHRQLQHDIYGVLAVMGDSPRSVKDEIKTLASDPKTDLRMAAALLYFKITSNAKAVMPDILNVLQRKDDMVLGALHVLSEMGNIAKEAIPALEKITKGNDQYKVAMAIDFPGTDSFSNYVRKQAQATLKRVQAKPHVLTTSKELQAAIGKRIAIKGKTKNTESGAAMALGDTEVCIIGMNQWSPLHVDQKAEATGVLVRRKLDSKSAGSKDKAYLLTFCRVLVLKDEGK